MFTNKKRLASQLGPFEKPIFLLVIGHFITSNHDCYDYVILQLLPKISPAQIAPYFYAIMRL
jgi:hypothetical protein